MSYGPVQPVARLTLAPSALRLVYQPDGRCGAAIRDCRLIHDRIHPMVRCRAAAADFRIDDRALRSVGRSLLIDLGCGPGRDLRYFRSLGHDVVGLDGSTEFVAMARSYSECEGSPTEFPRDEITEEPLRWHLCERIAEAFLVVSSRV